MNYTKASIAARVLLQKTTQRISSAAPFKLCKVMGSGLHTTPRLRRTTVPNQVQKSTLESLKERGLFHSALLRHYESKFQELTIAEDGKHVNITWADGHKSSFHSAWLRFNCHCPECRMEHNGVICLGPDDIDVNIRVTSVDVEDEEVLMMTWLYSDGVTTHDGYIPLAWLRKHCNSPVSMEKRSKASSMTFHKEKIIPKVNYDDVINTDQGLYKWLCDLEEKGIGLIKNCPLEEGIAMKVAGRISYPLHSIYGKFFDVYAQPQPISAAYSPIGLQLHMDLPMYERAPGLQLLHCIKFDPVITGGENEFADTFELALKLREERPDYFETLTKTPIAWNNIQYDGDFKADMVVEKPMFELDNKGELMTVLWHPMQTHVGIKDEQVEPFFNAFKYFFNMVTSNKSMYTLRMEAGDMITFNNRRLVHGRSPYTYSEEGSRWLQGTYVELSEFRNRLQVFHNTLGDGRQARRIGMNSWQ